MLVDRTSATYIGVNVWSQPVEARVFARLLLSEMMRHIWKQDTRVLLLLKHPELLFELEQILPLFAALEQNRGSVFAAIRSIPDLGRLGSACVMNARTVIAHRSNPSPRLTSCISLPWRPGHFFEKTVRSLPDDECFVIHAGESTHVRVKQVDSASKEICEEEVPWLDLNSPDEDDEALFANLFGPGEEKKRASATFKKRDAPYTSLRSASDKAHLRHALSMLGYQDLER